MEIPASLQWAAAEPGGRAWLERLPSLAGELAAQWSVSLEGPPMTSDQALVVPGTRADGMPVVLKIKYTHGTSGEVDPEAAALAELDGVGAVRLLEEDAERHALLVERCVPATPLAQSPEEAMEVIGRLLPRQWRPAARPFPLLAERTAQWEASLPGLWQARGRPFERELLDAAVGYLRQLAPTQRDVARWLYSAQWDTWDG